jgi:hyperosmotically inducible periplasmic protein
MLAWMQGGSARRLLASCAIIAASNHYKMQRRKKVMRPLKVLRISLLSLMLGAYGAAQNAPSNTGQKQEPLQTRDSNRNSTPQRGGSEWLHREVRHELVMLSNLSVFDNLAYRIDGDKVTLLGQVSRPSLKSDAESVVKKVEGVASVDNQIEILPNSPSDDRLRLALYRSIFTDGVLYRYGIQAVPPIHLIVNNGHVTLEGVVSNENEKNLAYIKANSVPGIFSVTNNLQVENAAK